MKNVEQAVLKCHTNVMKTNNIDKVSDISMEMTQENGIDSLGIVTLIVEIEDELDMELDAYLADIRKCKTIGELINVIRNVQD